MRLEDLPSEWPNDVLPHIHEELAKGAPRLVVLDDDPTGTQTTHGVLVVTDWSVPELVSALKEAPPALFVLTNSRALPQAEAVALAREAGTNLARAAREAGVPISVGYRGDSTLRGHYPAESWALREAIESELGMKFDAELIIPFFGEGGRFTIGDVHYVQQGDVLTPAGETEFARDAAFGFRASDLKAWVEEKSGGRVKAADVGSVSIENIRTGGPDHVADVLCTLKPGQIAAVNSASYRDIEVFALGLLRAEARGRRFIYRTAASFVRARAGLAGRPLLSAGELYDTSEAKRGGLVVFGSHVQRSTEQLGVARELPGVESREVDVSRLLDDAQRADEISSVARWLESTYAAGTDTLIYTSRNVVTGSDAESSLRISQSVASALVEIVSSLQTPPRFVVAKGGITSNDLALKAFGVHRAMVPGQVAPGVPCWVLGPETKFPGLPYVIFPGNVGTPQTVADVIKLIRGS